ncbi:MAG: hypothetical protein GXO49_08215 [Chlorobi bacterium]|nr:hypothetical protein [Chlorobiota bacterium]
MKLGKVEKQSTFYAILKAYAKFFHDNFFYKEVTHIGTENIPKDKPVLIAPNHQNALMDALAVIFSQDIQPVFLARSDIFQNPILAKILFKFKILPVFRIRDGKEKLKLNDLIYAKTIEVLEKHRQVAIFPEAQHIDKKHVRQLKKGIQRIAFMLEEKNNFNANVCIIPTGIYYSNYWNFRSKLVVKFGKPIYLNEYFEDYKKDPARTIVKFTEMLHNRLKEEAIHISDLNYHDEYDLLRDINEKQMLEELSLKLNPENKLKADKATIKKIDNLKENKNDIFLSLIDKVKKYSAYLKELNIKDWVVTNKKSNLFLRFILLFLSLPIFIYGFINNAIVYFLPNIVTSKFEDKQFTSSVVYVFVILINPIIYLLQSIVVLLIFKSWIIALIYFITTPIMGLLAFSIHRYFVKTMAILRFSKLNESKKQEIKNLRKEILEILK